MTVLLTLALAAFGGAAAALLALPAAWLSGSMFAVGIATISGVRTRVPAWMIETVFVFLGVSMGASVTPQTLERIAAWPLSMALLALTIVAIIVAVSAYLARVAGWERLTAFFSSIPGTLSYVLALASGTSADLRRIAVSQSVRLFMLVAVLPGAITLLDVGSATPPATAATAELDREVVVMAGLLLAGGAALGWLLRILRLPGAMLVGGLLVSAAAHVTGLVTVALPQPIVTVGMVVLGALIGERFAGATWRGLARLAIPSLMAFVITGSIAALGAFAASELFGLPFGQTLLAFAPGGLEAMTILSFVLQLDPAFVAAHQIARFVAMALLLPVWLKFVTRASETG